MKTGKRIIAIILSFVLIVAFFEIPVRADEKEEEIVVECENAVEAEEINDENNNEVDENVDVILNSSLKIETEEIVSEELGEESCGADNDYTTWKQYDPRWGSARPWPNASIPTFAEAGCYITSVAILLRHYNVVTDSNVNTFNPLICNNKLMSVGAVNSAGDMVPSKISAAYSGFIYQGTQTYSVSNLKNLLNSGYACIVSVNNNGHFVAISSVNGSTVTMMDPGSSATNLASQYSSFNRIMYFKVIPSSEPKDTTPPTITNVKVYDISTMGYTVSCEATDASGIMKVQFPTWTEYKDQDDLVHNWFDTGSPVSGVRKNGNTWEFRVNDKDHNFEDGTYITDIYAYDNNWNRSKAEAGKIVLHKDYIPVKTVSAGGHVYTLFHDAVTWETAEAQCEKMGGYLATITSEGEQKVINQLLSSGKREGYYIGARLNKEKGVYEWANGEKWTYANWHDKQPDNSGGRETILTLSYEGRWNDRFPGPDNIGFIMEQDLEERKEIKILNNDLKIEKRTEKQIEYAILPASLSDKEVCFESSDENIAVVSDKGMVRGVGEGIAEIVCRLKEDETVSAVCRVEVFCSYCNITFNSCGGSIIPMMKLEKNMMYGELPLPEREHYIFSGWYTQADGSGEHVRENSIVLEDITLYAKWTKENACIDLKDVYVSPVKPQMYTGSPICPAIAIKDGNDILSEDADYDIIYLNNVNASDSAQIIITGKRDYAGIKKINFVIRPKDIAETSVEVEDICLVDNSAEPKVIVYDKGSRLIPERDYRVSGYPYVSVGKAFVTISGVGNYTGAVKQNFMVYETGTELISDTNISIPDLPDDGYVYSGKKIRPKVIIEDKQGNEVSKKDYTVKYKNNKNAGIASIMIKGRGKKYKGKRTYYFTIHQVDISERYIISGIPDKYYTGKSIRPSVNVVEIGKKKKLKAKTHYTVSYRNNMTVGSDAEVTVTGVGNYKGILKQTFCINEQMFGKGFSVKGQKVFQYTGDAIEPDFQVYYKGRRLKKERDYTVSYINNVFPGTASVIIQAVEGSGFRGDIIKNFKIK